MRDELRTGGVTATILQAASSTISRLTWSDVAIGAAVFAGALVVNLVLVAVVLLRMPPTYLHEDYAHEHTSGGSALGGIARKIALNVVGLVLVAIGIVTSLPGVPGQGLLTIVIGIALMDVPGKHRLVRAVLGRENVLRRVNAFRHRFGVAPLVL